MPMATENQPEKEGNGSWGFPLTMYSLGLLVRFSDMISKTCSNWGQLQLATQRYIQQWRIVESRGPCTKCARNAQEL